MGKLESVYARLPVWGQHAAVSAYGLYWHWLRFGPGYARAVEGFRERQRFERRDWNEWTRGRLEAVLRHALEAPYYRETWTSAEKRAAARGRLDELPLLGKEPIRADPRRFVVPCRVRELVFHTSGSTGTPIASVWTVRELRASLALREVRSANWAGVSFSSPRATFSGRLAEPDPDSKGPFHRVNLVERQVYFSAFHLRPDTAAQYIAALQRHGVRWLTGYAVSYFLLGKLMLEQSLRAPGLSAVVTTSEKVTPTMREVMEKAFGCRVFEEYSTVENAVFASECEQGRLHVSPDAAHIEILRPDGTPCDPGEVGEVVATSLLRVHQPFVRFKVGDLAAWDDVECPCGRQMPVLKEVIGRVEDVVVGPDGRRMVRFHGVFADLPHVREGQIVQERVDAIRVKVVRAEGYERADEAEIVRRVQARLGPAVRVVVEPVGRIPRTAAGKFQAVVSLLPPEGHGHHERRGDRT